MTNLIMILFTDLNAGIQRRAIHRSWPAVPRIGDDVDITLYPGDPGYEQDETSVAGSVVAVLWGDYGIPEVRFR